MTPVPIRVLLDENVQVRLRDWLQERKPLWDVFHVYDVGLEYRPDSEVFAWVQASGCLIITFDKTFATGRDFAVGGHYGLIRLRVAPTGAGESIDALESLLERVDEELLPGAKIIVRNNSIRVFLGLQPEE